MKTIKNKKDTNRNLKDIDEEIFHDKIYRVSLKFVLVCVCIYDYIAYENHPKTTTELSLKKVKFPFSEFLVSEFCF